MNLLSKVMRIAMGKRLQQANRYFTLSLLLFLVIVGHVSAQNFSGHNWYFGNSDFGIRFSRSD
ncbi:MAG: hypothetical protein WD824_23825, partial [Cyclobacteriaceae bacterium]